jgi:hypothetical protein
MGKGREEEILFVNFDHGVVGGIGFRWNARRKGGGGGNKNELPSREGMSRNIDV